jgi:hypothetical protein
MGQVKAMLLDRLNHPDHLVQLELDDLMGTNADPDLPESSIELEKLPLLETAIESDRDMPF